MIIRVIKDRLARPIGLIDAGGLLYPFFRKRKPGQPDGAGKRRIGYSPQEATMIQER